MTFRVIVKAMPERQECIDYLTKNLPLSEFCFDQKKCAFDTFLRSLQMAGDDAVIHCEEDIIITTDFVAKAQKVINMLPNNVIQFFSMRKNDTSEGSRWCHGSDFLMNQCFYFPKFYSSRLHKFYSLWQKTSLAKKNPTGTDMFVRWFLTKTKQKYWIHCPNLVDHREGISMIDPRRARTNRQSFTFVDPVI